MTPSAKTFFPFAAIAGALCFSGCESPRESKTGVIPATAPAPVPSRSASAEKPASPETTGGTEPRLWEYDRFVYHYTGEGDWYEKSLELFREKGDAGWEAYAVVPSVTEHSGEEDIVRTFVVYFKRPKVQSKQDPAQ